MEFRWLAIFANLCVVATIARSAAVPTQDTMVVSRSEETSATPATVSEPTSEEPQPPIKLTEMDVQSHVSMRYAQTFVTAHVRNPAKRAQEAHFRVLLPETAFISGFVMTIAGKAYTAYVKEKEEAKQIYQNAISQGLGAAHISTKARDSNHFTVSVNVEALSSAIFNLTYEELLVRRNSVYNHAINLHPGALVPKLTVTVNIKEAVNISELRVPEIRTGNEIDASKDDAQNSQVTIVRSDDGREATIKFTPDLQEQERLIQIYTQKAKDSAAATPTYSWSSQPNEKEPEGVLGQFVVQYDVTRPKDGEILVNDGYFVHFYAPSDLPPLSKFVVFVLDTSGSMSDRKIIQLREAMKVILGNLNPGDYFSIVEFDSDVKVHDLKEAEGEPPKKVYNYFSSEQKTTLVPPSQATPENIERAKLIVSWLEASGGTNIGKALEVAVQLIQKGIDWQPEPNVTSVPSGDNATVAATTSTTPGSVETSVAVTSEKVEDDKAKSLEPIIMFLTDGDPTVGEVNPTRITSALSEKNDGPRKAIIFSLGFGEDADRKFLRKISLRNGGFARHIYEAADAALQLRDFYRQISSPLLSHVKFTYPKDQVKENSVTKHEFRTLFGGSELVVTGRVDDTASEIAPTVSAFCGLDDKYTRSPYKVTPKAPVEQKKPGYLPLERLWSYLTIKQLLDEREAAEDDEKPADEDKQNTPEKKALRLALKYSFVTPLTSLVVVKPNETNSVDAESVDKAGKLPKLYALRRGTPTFKKSIGVRTNGFKPDRYPGGVPLSGVGGYAAFSAPGLPSSLFAYSPSTQQMLMSEAVEEYEDYSDGGLVTTRSESHSFFHDLNLTGQRVMDALPLPLLTTARPSIATTTVRKPSLSDYHLQDYAWAESLLDALSDSLVLNTNGTTVTLKLVKDLIAPKEANGDVSCARAASGGGGAGVCVYLTRCDSARRLTLDEYSNTYCSLSDGYAGVCCQQSKVDVAT